MHCQWRPFNICVWDVLRLSSFFSWKVPVAMFGYFALAAVVLKTAAPDYKELWRELSRLEGRFAFVHARTKSCAVRHLDSLVPAHACSCWGPAVVLLACLFSLRCLMLLLPCSDSRGPWMHA